MKKISMIIPCYNEEGNVELFYNEVLKAYGDEKYSLELIFIDDGSTDNTLSNLKKIESEKNCDVKIVSFSRNFGKESAIYAGLKNSSGDYTVIIDVDLQQPPVLTLEMAHILDENQYDCVCYFQEIRKEGKMLASIKNLFYKIMNRMSEVEMVQGASDFRMFKTNVRDAIVSMSEYYRFTKGIFSWIGFDTFYLPYVPNERNAGDTKWSFKKLLKYGFSGIISFSTVPIKLSTYLGFVLAFLSFFYLLIILVQKIFFEIAVPGYATIVVSILLIGGIQLFCIGIIGEYIARTYIETKNRPIYITKEEVVNGKNKKII